MIQWNDIEKLTKEVNTRIEDVDHIQAILSFKIADLNKKINEMQEVLENQVYA